MNIFNINQLVQNTLLIIIRKLKYIFIHMKQTMILQNINQDIHNPNNTDTISSKIGIHRRKFDNCKSQILSNNNDLQLLRTLLSLNQLIQQKQQIITDLDRIDGNQDDQFQYFQELAYYQQRYIQLIQFMKKQTPQQYNHEKFEIIKKNFDKDFRISAGIYNLDDPFNKKKDNNSQMNSDKYNNKFEEQSSISSGQLKQKKGLQSVKYNSIRGNGITKPIFDFFDKKQRQQTKIGFKNVINPLEINNNRVKDKSPRATGKSFKKTGNNIDNSKVSNKGPATTIQIQKLLQQNKRLHGRLQNKAKQQNQLNQFEKNVLRQQRQICMKRIEELEEQIQDLQRNNYRLKQVEKQRQKSKNNGESSSSAIFNDTYQQGNNTYSPYNIPIRQNDLGKISHKNNKRNSNNPSNQEQKFFDMLSDIPPIQKKQQTSFNVQLKPNAGYINHNNINRNMNNPRRDQNDSNDDFLLANLLTQKTNKNQIVGNKPIFHGDSIMNSVDRGSNFDSFSIANTAYNNSSLFLNASKNLIAINSQTSTRNKVGFFKKSLVIVSDQQYEIAFKKSQLDTTMKKIRIIFYIHNKKNTSPKVNIQYDYEMTHYTVDITEQLKQLPPFGQSREVIQVKLANSCQDLNSVIDAHFKIGNKSYDLWVPACFIQFSDSDQSLKGSRQGYSNMIIQPDRQFRSYQYLSKLIRMSRKVIPKADQSQTYFTGTSLFGKHQITLNWWQKQLTIQTDMKILDFLSFIMHHFK